MCLICTLIEAGRCYAVIGHSVFFRLQGLAKGQLPPQCTYTEIRLVLIFSPHTHMHYSSCCSHFLAHFINYKFSFEHLWLTITLYDRIQYTVQIFAVFAFLAYSKHTRRAMPLFLLPNIVMQANCLEYFVEEHVITVTLQMGLYYYHHLPANIWYLDAEQGSHYWTDADLLFHSQPSHCLTDGMGGWGGGKPGRYHWPSSPPHQLHQQHATCIMGPTHPLLWQKLNCPQAPQYNRALSPASCVEQLPPLAPWSLNKFSSSQRDVSCSLGLWLFINNGINNCCWGKKIVLKTVRKIIIIKKKPHRSTYWDDLWW